MLVLNEIRKSYGGSAVLEGVTLSVQRGRCVCMAGGNAQGKTTLLRIAAGALKPDGGSVTREGSVGYVPQHCELMQDLTVRDNLRLWYAACGRPARELFAEGTPECELGLAKAAGKLVSRLSGGFQRRVSIAAALAGKPRWLLLDEPFASLDVHSCGDVVALLTRFAKAGGGVLFSSHEPNVAARFANEINLLHGGVVREHMLLDSAATPEERARMVTELFCRIP